MVAAMRARTQELLQTCVAGALPWCQLCSISSCRATPPRCQVEGQVVLAGRDRKGFQNLKPGGRGLVRIRTYHAAVQPARSERILEGRHARSAICRSPIANRPKAGKRLTSQGCDLPAWEYSHRSRRVLCSKPLSLPLQGFQTSLSYGWTHACADVKERDASDAKVAGVLAEGLCFGSVALC